MAVNVSFVTGLQSRIGFHCHRHRWRRFRAGKGKTRADGVKEDVGGSDDGSSNAAARSSVGVSAHRGRGSTCGGIRGRSRRGCWGVVAEERFDDDGNDGKEELGPEGSDLRGAVAGRTRSVSPYSVVRCGQASGCSSTAVCSLSASASDRFSNRPETGAEAPCLRLALCHDGPRGRGGTRRRTAGWVGTRSSGLNHTALPGMGRAGTKTSDDVMT
jgi:hypothetical protein